MAIDRREIERLLPQMRRYARGLASDRASADDLVHDTVVRALANERQFKSGNLAGWLYTILTNTARSHLRASRRRPHMAPLDDVSDGGADPATRIGILSALGAIATEYREVLLLTAVEGFSYRETSEILDVPIGTVMSRLARARDQLAERLDGAPVVPIRRAR